VDVYTLTYKGLESLVLVGKSRLGFRFRLWLSLFHFRLINYIIKLAAMGLKDSLPRAPNKSHVYGESFKLPSYSAGPFALLFLLLLLLLLLGSSCLRMFLFLFWRTHSISLNLTPSARSN